MLARIVSFACDSALKWPSPQNLGSAFRAADILYRKAQKHIFGTYFDRFGDSLAGQNDVGPTPPPVGQGNVTNNREPSVRDTRAYLENFVVPRRLEGSGDFAERAAQSASFPAYTRTIRFCDPTPEAATLGQRAVVAVAADPYGMLATLYPLRETPLSIRTCLRILGELADADVDCIALHALSGPVSGPASGSASGSASGPGVGGGGVEGSRAESGAASLDTIYAIEQRLLGYIALMCRFSTSLETFWPGDGFRLLCRHFHYRQRNCQGPLGAAVLSATFHALTAVVMGPSYAARDWRRPLLVKFLQNGGAGVLCGVMVRKGEDFPLTDDDMEAVSRSYFLYAGTHTSRAVLQGLHERDRLWREVFVEYTRMARSGLVEPLF